MPPLWPAVISVKWYFIYLMCVLLFGLFCTFAQRCFCLNCITRGGKMWENKILHKRNWVTRVVCVIYAIPSTWKPQFTDRVSIIVSLLYANNPTQASTIDCKYFFFCTFSRAHTPSLYTRTNAHTHFFTCSTKFLPSLPFLAHTPTNEKCTKSHAKYAKRYFLVKICTWNLKWGHHHHFLSQ